MMTRNRQSGYTLLELLVVMGVLAVVTTIGGSAMFKIMSHWSATRSKAELHRTADNIFNSMRADLNAVVASPLANVPLQGTDDAAQGKDLFYRINLANDAWTAEIHTEGSGGRHVTQTVSYRIDRAEEGNFGTLSRVVTAAGSDEEQAQALSEGVLQFDVQYAARGGAEWVPEWTQSGLPGALRVSITVMDPDRSELDTVVARKAVIPIHVE